MTHAPINRPTYKTVEVFEPIFDDYALIVCPEQRIRFENRAAKPGANAVRIIRRKGT